MSINRRMDKEYVRYIYIYLSIYLYIQGNITQPLKRNKIAPFAEMWMDLETVIQSEVKVKSEKEKQILYIKADMWNLGK